MKVAIVHDWLTNMGGAEKIIKILHGMFPDAPIYTLVYDKDNMPNEFKSMDIRTSVLQKIPFSKKKYQSLLPLMPTAVEQFNLSDYDVVISSSTCCAKGIITGTDTLHICYCNTPMRYGWDFYHNYIENKNRLSKVMIAFSMNYIRLWDRLSADRVDNFISNSNNVSKRIRKHYKRESKVIYPPVDTGFYTPSNENEDYYLIVSRLVPYKRVDLAIKVFNELGLPLIIIGEGSELKTYIRVVKNNIKLMGKLSDDEVRDYYRKCKAFIFPGEEDFGITPVEAQACGRPVIAFGKGGALETVVNDKTGIFFNEQNTESLKEAVLSLEKNISQFDKEVIRQHSLKFSIDRFREEMNKFIKEKVKSFR